MNRRIEIIAHRGSSKVAPENTRAAVRRGWVEGADAVEVDCRLTRHGEVVVIHDATTQRTTGRRWKVAERSLAELATLDVGRWKGARWAGETIPTLLEIIDLVPTGKRLFIELKDGLEMVAPVARVLDQTDAPHENLVVIARSTDLLSALKSQFPKVAYYLVADFRYRRRGHPRRSIAELIAAAHAASLDGLDLKADGPYDSAAIKLLAEDNLTFHVWTVDRVSQARRLIELGVDGIATNRPGWLREQLQMTTGAIISPTITTCSRTPNPS